MTTTMVPERERHMSDVLAKLWLAVKRFFATMNRGYAYKNHQWTQDDRRRL
jgi:hypothetical protein